MIDDEPFDPPERLGTLFLEWAAKTDDVKLRKTLQAITAEGARVVQGRSRGGGKRSALRLEPMIMGQVRGAGTTLHHGGRPRDERSRMLVVYLARDWWTGTGQRPKSGRSDNTGFGDLVHSLFQWLEEGSAENPLRVYWDALDAFEARETLEDFCRRHGIEL